MAFPSPFTNPDYYQRVRIGGLLIASADLVEVDGIKIEDEWSEQKPTGSSGATNVFKGTKPVAAVKLTFEAIDEDGFQELRAVWDLLAPKPGSGGNGSGNTTGSPGSAAASYTKSTGSPGGSQTAEQALAAAEKAFSAVGATTTTSSSSSSGTGTIPGITGGSTTTTATPNPGPKPPTLSVKNGYLNYIGVTAISRKSWEGPKVTATNSYRVIIEVVQQKDPTPAAVGASSPKALDPITGPGALLPKDPASGAKDANSAAAQAGAQ